MELNDRQRAYLLALYHHDQIAEHNDKRARLNGERTPLASVWRWIEYGPSSLPPVLNYHPALRLELKALDLVDQGAGATWHALAGRGLLACRSQALSVGPWQGTTLYVQLTRPGRALARKLKGETPAAKKNDELGIGAWRVLAYAYEMAPQRIDIYAAWHHTNTRPPSSPLMVSGIGKSLLRRGWVVGPDWSTLQLSDAGRLFYESHYAHYQELYPKVKAPQPLPTEESVTEGVEK